MGKFGRRGTRFFYALGKIGNGVDEYPNVFGGRDFNFNLDAKEKFLAVTGITEQKAAIVARSCDLRNYRRNVHAIHLFSSDFHRRRGGNDRNLLCMSRNGRDLGIVLS